MRSIDGNTDIVGFRFHPTDKELVDHYLWNKIHGRDSLVQAAINEVDDLFNKDPWELPGWSKIKSADQVWYFFSRRGYNKRVKRITDNGFWKITGKPRNVKGKNGSAVKKSLVFSLGRTPNAKWTPWVIHEYTFTSTVPDNKEGIFLCILKNKEDEKANTSPIESCQPTELADEEIPDNSTMFNPDEVLATLKEPDGRHELPRLSNSEEQNDEWISYLTNDDELYPDERSTEQVLGNEGCNMPLVDTSMTSLEESSRKRSHFEDGVLRGAIEDEECEPMVESDSTMLDAHADSMKLQALAMVKASNVTLTAVQPDPHGRERMIYVHNESREMDVPAVESVVDPHCIVRATRFHDPHCKMERSQGLIEKESYPKRITKRRKFYEKIVSQDKAIDVKQPAAVVNLPKPTMESNGKCKTTERNYGNMKLQMHLNESADGDKKGFFICIDKPSLNRKSFQPPLYFVNALLGIVLFISVIYELISVAIGPRHVIILLSHPKYLYFHHEKLTNKSCVT